MAAFRRSRQFARKNRPAPVPKRAMLTAFLLLALAISPSSFGQEADIEPAPAVGLFLMSPQGALDEAGSFTPIDPVTLADLPDAAALEIDAAIWNTAVSADGSTLATVEIAGLPLMSTELASVDIADVTVVIRDGETGDERVRFSLPPEADLPQLSTYSARFLPHLNYTGTRLAMQIFAGGPWCVFDTGDGELLSLVQPPESSLHHDWVDQDLTRLYHLVAAPLAEEPATEPPPTRLIAYALDTGAEIGELELPAAPAGFWESDRIVQNENVLAYAMPGIALSPDGTQLAVVHASDEAITLIDTEPFAIDRTIEITRPVSAIDRVLGLVGFAPQPAAAKAPMDQSIRSTVYAADGQRLYLSGIEHMALTTDDVMSRGQGLRLIDLHDGTVLAEAFPDGLIDSVLPTSDGQHLYVTGLSDDADGGAERFILRRLDPDTLESLAERAFSSYQWVLVHPIPANRE